MMHCLHATIISLGVHGSYYRVPQSYFHLAVTLQRLRCTAWASHGSSPYSEGPLLLAASAGTLFHMYIGLFQWLSWSQSMMTVVLKCSRLGLQPRLFIAVAQAAGLFYHSPLPDIWSYPWHFDGVDALFGPILVSFLCPQSISLESHQAWGPQTLTLPVSPSVVPLQQLPAWVVLSRPVRCHRLPRGASPAPLDYSSAPGQPLPPVKRDSKDSAHPSLPPLRRPRRSATTGPPCP